MSKKKIGWKGDERQSESIVYDVFVGEVESVIRKC